MHANRDHGNLQVEKGFVASLEGSKISIEKRQGKSSELRAWRSMGLSSKF